MKNKILIIITTLVIIVLCILLITTEEKVEINKNLLNDIELTNNGTNQEQVLKILNCIKDKVNNNNICNYDSILGIDIPIELNIKNTKEIHYIRVVNTTKNEKCKNKDYSETACGIVLEFSDIIDKQYMNYNDELGTNKGGFKNSILRSYLNTTILESIDPKIRNIILDTRVLSSRGNSDKNNFETIDKLYLLSTSEIYSGGHDTIVDLTNQLDYYKENNVSSNNYSKAIKKYNNINTSYWLRSAYSREDYSFYIVEEDGYIKAEGSNNKEGISPAFRI